MLVLIDNYDSFSYNLVQALAVLGVEVRVFRNDATTAAEVEALGPQAVVVSPGPCSPAQAGISVETIRHFSGRLPVLGVCLGHQSIAAAFGAPIRHARSIMHGKTSRVRHAEVPLYDGLDNPFVAGRYHSLVVRQEEMPDELEADAWTEDGEIMGLHHRVHPTYGVQFHPESVLTPQGPRLLANFLRLAGLLPAVPAGNG